MKKGGGGVRVVKITVGVVLRVEEYGKLGWT